MPANQTQPQPQSFASHYPPAEPTHTQLSPVYEERSPTSPQPSFLQPTIPPDPYGSGSIRHQESGRGSVASSGSGDVHTIRGGSGSFRQQSPQPSFVQPTIHSTDYGGGSIRHGSDGSEEGYYPPQQQHPSALSIQSPARSSMSAPHQFNLHDELAQLASRFMMRPTRNKNWKPNGPMDVCLRFNLLLVMD